MLSKSMHALCCVVALVLIVAQTTAGPPRHDPSPEAGLIKLNQPQPKDVDFFANWYHNRTHGFRVLIPVGAKLAFSWKSTIDADPLLRMTLHQDQVADLYYLPPKADQAKHDAIKVLKEFASQTMSEIISCQSLTDTNWHVVIANQEIDGKSQPRECAVTELRNGGLLLFLLEINNPFEGMKANMIVDSLELVSPSFVLSDRLQAIKRVKPEDPRFPQRFAFAYQEEGLVSGLIREVDGRGKTVRAETAVRGQAHGLDYTLYSTGATYMVRCYLAGRCQGLLYKYYRDGNVYCVTQIVDDNAHGTDTIYFRSGKVSSITECNDGDFHGTTRHFLPDGQIYAVTEFDRGAEVETRGVLELSDEQGEELDSAMQDIYEVIDGVWPNRERVTLRRLQAEP